LAELSDHEDGDRIARITGKVVEEDWRDDLHRTVFYQLEGHVMLNLKAPGMLPGTLE
jgi:hypothetical protein